ncbi:MAG: ABC transporter permease [Candidatus Omnitrophica bacterium]|nr:ABC transporter permease [Candidatus Omnitrophota bacterium]MDE2222624.1 ABC transporter permease [Candidatus Omnitrophota bacterium]
MIHQVTNPIGVMALAKREIHRFFSVANQTIFPPLVSSALFMYIFGIAVGSRVNFSAMGLTYLQFIIPGLMAMHLISSAYENTSSSLFIGRWHNHIQEILLAPLSYIEMVLGLLAGGVARGMLVCLGIWLVSLFFTPGSIIHPLALIYFMLMITVIFSCAGMMGALWAEDFGMLSMWNTYVIIPLALLGGVFHPISLLLPGLQIISHFNPLYYMVSGIRYSMTNVTDTPVATCAIVSLGMAAAVFTATVYLFKIGYKLRT